MNPQSGSRTNRIPLAHRLSRIERLSVDSSTHSPQKCPPLFALFHLFRLLIFNLSFLLKCEPVLCTRSVMLLITEHSVIASANTQTQNVWVEAPSEWFLFLYVCTPLLCVSLFEESFVVVHFWILWSQCPGSRLIECTECFGEEGESVLQIITTCFVILSIMATICLAWLDTLLIGEGGRILCVVWLITCAPFFQLYC